MGMDMCVLGIWGSRYTAGGYGYVCVRDMGE